MTKEVVHKPKEIRHSVNGWKDGYQETCNTGKHEDAPGDKAFFHDIFLILFERKMKTRVVTNQGIKLIMIAIMTPKASPSPTANRLEIWPWASCATVNKRIKYPVPSGKLNEACDQTVNVLKEEGCKP